MTVEERNQLATRITRKVLNDLYDRNGYKLLWDSSSAQVKVTIRRALVEIVSRELLEAQQDSEIPPESLET